MPESESRTYSRQLADFITGLTYDDLPDETIHAAKRSLLDTVGAAVHGSDAGESRLILKTATQALGHGPAPVWGTSQRTAIGGAALANGSAAHAREMDDFGGCGHSGAVVIPAVLAITSLDKTFTGRDLIVAIVAGYDIAARVTLSVGGYGPHNEAGWHSTATCGAFGAAAAAGKLLALDTWQLTSAIGLAGTYGGGLWAFIDDGAMSKRLHPGKAAESGSMAAMLARTGFTGPTRIFEARWGGFWNTYARHDFNPASLVEGLGERFHIHSSGFKPYAACRGVHSSLDVVLRHREELHLLPDHIDNVTISMHPRRAQMIGGTNIETVLDAQMSVAYGVAVAIARGDASVVQYSEDTIHDPAIASLMERVTVVTDETMPPDKQPNVEIRLSSGECVRDSVDFALGAPENPLSDEALHAKFRSLAGTRFPEDQVRLIADAIWNVDQAESLAPLNDLLLQHDGAR